MYTKLNAFLLTDQSGRFFPQVYVKPGLQGSLQGCIHVNTYSKTVVNVNTCTVVRLLYMSILVVRLLYICQHL